MEKNFTAILVDDEESARDVLSNLLIRFCPSITLLEKYSNIESAVKGIEKHKPDVVFLDIEMPNYAGYEIVNFFEEIDFEIIFVTAYDKYAVKAFEISAIDYLLKPIEIDRLKKSVEKLQDKVLIKDKNQFKLLEQTLKSNVITSIIITDKGYQTKIDLDTVIAFEAKESYCCIHTESKKYVASKNLKHFEGVLSENKNFFRVHKSWLVNLDFMEKFSKSNLEINLKSGIVAKLSKYRKAEFEQAIIAV